MLTPYVRLAALISFTLSACNVTAPSSDNSATQATPLEFVAPNKPSPRMVPAKTSGGNAVTGQKLPATAVFSFSEQENYALYGFIVVDGQNELHGFFWNKAINMKCTAFAERENFAPYFGSLRCKQAGATFIEGPFGISSEYGARGEGEFEKTYLLDGGDKAVIRLEWDSDGFPDVVTVASRLAQHKRTKPKTVESRKQPAQIAYEESES